MRLSGSFKSHALGVPFLPLLKTVGIYFVAMDEEVNQQGDGKRWIHLSSSMADCHRVDDTNRKSNIYLHASTGVWRMHRHENQGTIQSKDIAT